METIFTKFEFSTTFHFQDVNYSLKWRFFLETLLPIKNKISKSYCIFLTFNKCLADSVVQCKAKCQNYNLRNKTMFNFHNLP